MPNEFELVCWLARSDFVPELPVTPPLDDFARIDWPALRSLAERNGVLPLVARNLLARLSTQYYESIPAPVAASLRAAYDANLKRSLWFTAELGRLMRHFESKNLRVLPFKGPLLAQAAYGDPGLRSFSDLDFLISAADFSRAKAALAEMEYFPAAGFTDAVERFWLRKGNERAFDCAAGKNLLELQWALLPYFYAVDLRVEDLLARAQTALVADRATPCLSPEDSLLVLCLHAAKHLWGRLIWLVDIAETLRAQPIDHDLILTRARQSGLARVLGVSFWLAKNLLRTEFSSPVERLIREAVAVDSQVPVLGAEFAARLARGATYDFEATEYFSIIPRLRERRRDRWRYFWRLIWTPGVGDLATVRLPDPLFPFYRVIRMARLVRRLAR